ncbi:lysis protein [Pseudomonas umsongensis]|uniref:lysis protein n=1 Tax=Pseudomonas umsongensis TaxID=198618 RepID=UPI003ECC7DBA
MNAAAPKMALAGVLVLLAVGGTWKVQDLRYGKQLAEQAALHLGDLTAISNAAADQVRIELDKRLALEQRLAASDQTHHQVLTNVQKDQARLRDRLATADLRLSVLLDATDSAGGCSVPAGSQAGGVVHGAARARIDPAHAQRIIEITGDGDEGLIALAACQAYVKEVSASK